MGCCGTFWLYVDTVYTVFGNFHQQTGIRWADVPGPGTCNHPIHTNPFCYNRVSKTMQHVVFWTGLSKMALVFEKKTWWGGFSFVELRKGTSLAKTYYMTFLKHGISMDCYTFLHERYIVYQHIPSLKLTVRTRKCMVWIRLFFFLLGPGLFSGAKTC